MELFLSKNINVLKTKLGNYYIFDSLCGNLTKINKDMFFLINNFNNKINFNEEKIKKAKDFLVKNHFLIDKNYDELENLKKNFKKYLKESKSGEFVSNLRLNLSQSCNCACKYCYVSKIDALKDNCFMSWNVAKKAVNKFMEMAKKNMLKKVTIRFFGGEPLLNLFVFKKSVEYSSKLSKKYGIRINYLLNTNGTLVSEEISKFIYKNKITIVLSLDGLEKEHNRNRIFRDGGGTFNDIDENLNTFLKFKNKVVISTVVTPETNITDFKKFIDYLKSKGIKHLGTLPMQTYVKKGNSKKKAEKIVNLLIESKKYGLKKGVIVKGPWELLFVKLTHPSFSYCGGIGKEFSISPKGEIYPCCAILRKLGTIENMEKIPSNKEYEALLRRSIPFLKKCRGCEIEAICSGGCAAEAEHVYNDINSPSPDCYLRKILVKKMIVEDNPKIFLE